MRRVSNIRREARTLRRISKNKPGKGKFATSLCYPEVFNFLYYNIEDLTKVANFTELDRYQIRDFINQRLSQKTKPSGGTGNF